MKYRDIDSSLTQIKKQSSKEAIDIMHNGDNAAPRFIILVFVLINCSFVVEL